MKIKEVTATAQTVILLIEAEHPAEVALINLLANTEAKCSLVSVAPDTAQKALTVNPVLSITATIKSGRGY